MSKMELPSFPSTKLMVSGEEFVIPNHTAKLLYISQATNPTSHSGLSISLEIDVIGETIGVKKFSPDEPSTIFTILPIVKPFDVSQVPTTGYYPSYLEFTPEQKWIYLNWLTDTLHPINISYVFVYYYGLERHLLLGDFDSAFDEIVSLRNVHARNSSFDFYSRSALLNSAIFKKRIDRLEQLFQLVQPDRFSNMDLILAYRLGYDLGVEGLMRLAPNLKSINKNYIKKYPNEFKSALLETLDNEFQKPAFPFSSIYDISSIPRQHHVLYANISFPTEIRSPSLPSFVNYAPFVNETTRILNLAHQQVKFELIKRRNENHQSIL